MTKPKHTPGPWDIRSPDKFETDQIEDRLIITEDSQHVAQTYQYRNDDNHAADGAALANARLIAAAPDLLNVCKDAVAYFKSRNLGEMADTVQVILEVAIKKAEKK